MLGEGGGGHSFTHHDGCHNINVWRSSKILNSCNSCIYRYINLKLTKNFQNSVINTV